MRQQQPQQCCPTMALLGGGFWLHTRAGDINKSESSLTTLKSGRIVSCRAWLNTYRSGQKANQSSRIVTALLKLAEACGEGRAMLNTHGCGQKPNRIDSLLKLSSCQDGRSGGFCW
jgi:hypothetical protein